MSGKEWKPLGFLAAVLVLSCFVIVLSYGIRSPYEDSAAEEGVLTAKVVEFYDTLFGIPSLIFGGGDTEDDSVVESVPVAEPEYAPPVQESNPAPSAPPVNEQPSTPLEPKDLPVNDPYPQGNVPNAGGTNIDAGPGPYVPPAEMEQPPSTSYSPPPAPEPMAPPPSEPETGFVPAPGMEDYDSDYVPYSYDEPSTSVDWPWIFIIVIAWVAGIGLTGVIIGVIVVVFIERKKKLAELGISSLKHTELVRLKREAGSLIFKLDVDVPIGRATLDTTVSGIALRSRSMNYDKRYTEFELLNREVQTEFTALGKKPELQSWRFAPRSARFAQIEPYALALRKAREIESGIEVILDQAKQDARKFTRLELEGTFLDIRTRVVALLTLIGGIVDSREKALRHRSIRRLERQLNGIAGAIERGKNPEKAHGELLVLEEQTEALEGELATPVEETSASA